MVIATGRLFARLVGGRLCATIFLRVRQARRPRWLAADVGGGKVERRVARSGRTVTRVPTFAVFAVLPPLMPGAAAIFPLRLMMRCRPRGLFGGKIQLGRPGLAVMALVVVMVVVVVVIVLLVDLVLSLKLLQEFLLEPLALLPREGGGRRSIVLVIT